MSRSTVHIRLFAAVAVTAAATVAAMVAVPASAAPAPASAPRAATPVTTNPGAGPASITGPIPSQGKPGDPAHDYIFYATPFNLKKAGYEEQEYFISGTATRYPSN